MLPTKSCKASPKNWEDRFNSDGPRRAGKASHRSFIRPRRAIRTVVALNVAKQIRAANTKVVQRAVKIAQVISKTNQSASSGASIEVTVQ